MAFAHPDSAATWVWVVDFTGYGFWHAMNGTSLASAFLKTFSAHYPERLGAVLLVDTPGAFSVLLGAVRLIIDARTMAKLHDVGGADHGARMAQLQRIVGPGVAMEWLRTALGGKVEQPIPPVPEGHASVAAATPPAGQPAVVGLPEWTQGTPLPDAEASPPASAPPAENAPAEGATKPEKPQ